MYKYYNINIIMYKYNNINSLNIVIYKYYNINFYLFWEECQRGNLQRIFLEAY